MCTIAFLSPTLLPVEVDGEDEELVGFAEGDIEYGVQVTEVGKDKFDLEFEDGAVARNVPSAIFEYVEDDDDEDDFI